MEASQCFRVLTYRMLRQPSFNIRDEKYNAQCFICGHKWGEMKEEDEAGRAEDQKYTLHCQNCKTSYSETCGAKWAGLDEEEVWEKLYKAAWKELQEMCESGNHVPKWLQEVYEDVGSH